MTTISKCATALMLLSGAAYAQVPSTNDTSDIYNNTGMGSGSLSALIGTPTCVTPPSGCSNTASGEVALGRNSTGNYNTAIGVLALFNNVDGDYNTATGYAAFLGAGTSNTADGAFAMQNAATGSDNTAVGFQALNGSPTAPFGTGSENTAIGDQALFSYTSGSGNTALGYQAGMNLTTGSDNIDIGNKGAAADNKLIKIGTEGTQKKTFIAGIYEVSVTGSPVYIASNGQLGTVVSSERFKTAIEPMGADTAKLAQLRPVTFHLKTDPKGALQYGLIAEEVAKVYPELVILDAKGRIDGVRYDELAPMLLNEVQNQQRANAAQAARIASLEQQLAGIQAALVKLQPKDELVAQR